MLVNFVSKFSNDFEDLIQDLFPRHIFRHLDVVGVLLPAAGGLELLEELAEVVGELPVAVVPPLEPHPPAALGHVEHDEDDVGAHLSAEWSETFT